MTNTAVQAKPPTMKDHERDILRPWFDLTGHDPASAQWATTWAALVSAGLADGQGLLLWPGEHDRPDCGPADTVVARTVRLALVAGAHYAKTTDTPAADEIVLDAGLGVEIVLGLLHKDPALLDAALGEAEQVSARRVLHEVRSRVLGVFADAPTALARQIGLVRASVAAHWPPLVELVLAEAVTDEVFAEHLLIRIAQSGIGSLDFVVVPSGRWVIFRGAARPAPTAVAPPPPPVSVP